MTYKQNYGKDGKAEYIPRKTYSKCKTCGAPSNGYVECFSCKKAKEEGEYQDKIHWGQSWNLAVQLISQEFGTGSVEEFYKIKIQEWQQWFYRKLQEKPMIDKAKAKDVSRDSFVNELEDNY